MIGEVCAEIRNYFVRHPDDIHSGTFTVTNGHIESLPFLQDGQYFRIVGSVFCDGVYKYNTDSLPGNETFTGTIWAMRVPKSFEDLCDEIETWCTNNVDALNSPYQSESFGGYSYSKGRSGESGGGYSWKDHFAAKLNPYRRVFA